MKDNKLRVKAIIDRNLRDIVLSTSKNNGIGFVSINSIDISSDYSFAKVYVSFFNKDIKKSFDKLVKLTPFIRHELSQKISIYKVPEITIINDDRFIIDEKMEKILKEDSLDLKKIKKEK